MSRALEALEKGRSLAQQGKVDAAIPVLRQAAESGLAEACVELARIERERGNVTEALAWLSKAEAIAHGGDSNANLSCYLAYQSMFGEGGLDVQQRKANAYLRKAAERDNPVAQTMLAQQLLLGLNGQEINEAEYDYWISKAIGHDFDDAILTHVRNLLRMKRAIDSRTRERLERLAVRSEEAKKLHSQIR